MREAPRDWMVSLALPWRHAGTGLALHRYCTRTMLLTYRDYTGIFTFAAAKARHSSRGWPRMAGHMHEKMENITCNEHNPNSMWDG